MALISVQQVNEMDYQEFIASFGNLVEHCSVFAAAVWALRPFTSLMGIHTAFCDFVDTLNDIGKEGILRSHPDLAGRLAQKGLLTSESTKEQLAAGLKGLTPQERELLTELNSKYRVKFGFPFVICARENKKNAILNGISQRLENSPKVELNTGVTEVKKIAFYRLLDVVEHTAEEAILHMS